MHVPPSQRDAVSGSNQGCIDAHRHELFNETNRDEVTADVLGWVGKTV